MPDTDKDSVLSFRAAQQWQRKASQKREEDLRRAGLGPRTSTDYYEEYSRRNTQTSRNSKIDSNNSSESLVELQRKKRRTLEATRISNTEHGFELCYHEPIKVKFKSTVERSSTYTRSSLN